MKNTILAAYAALVFAAALPWLFPIEASARELSEPVREESMSITAKRLTAAPAKAADRPAVSTPSPTPSPTPEPTPEPVKGTAIAPESVDVLVGNEVVTMELQEYLFGVTAAEMPASFSPEALKAQSVAARSYTLYCAKQHKHADAQVCTDPGCCQAWSSEERLRAAWGEQYDDYAAKLREAVEATRGEVLVYEGEAVFAAFHSSSAGRTEDCGAIWSETPYLLSVTSPETAADVPDYVSAVQCAAIDLRDTVLSRHPEADFSADASLWLGGTDYDESGRVRGAWLGGVYVSGTELRSLFSLRSTAFTLEYADGDFLFTVTGFGHGVGMSQYGANVMAQNGADYRAILSHYYSGTELTA